MLTPYTAVAVSHLLEKGAWYLRIFLQGVSLSNSTSFQLYSAGRTIQMWMCVRLSWHVAVLNVATVTRFFQFITQGEQPLVNRVSYFQC